MKELEYNEKIAILKVLKDLEFADNKALDCESEYIEQLAKEYGLTADYQTEIDNLATLQAMNSISNLDQTQKKEFAKRMGRMIVVDKDINYNEIKLYNMICDSCNIEKDFHIEDYPNYSLSGPFLNPEDI